MVFERLSAQDAAFLALEDADTPLHLGALAIFDVHGGRRKDGRLPIEAYRAVIASRLGLLPRYRMRLGRTPLTGHPVWVDDEHFDVRHHLHLVALPEPGDARALDEVVTDFLSQKLDRGRPLWEILVVDGLEGERVAAVFKAHHALIDGLSGVDMLLLLLSLQPSSEVPQPAAWSPRAAPSARELLAGELSSRLALGRGALHWLRDVPRARGRALAELRSRASGVAEMLRAGLRASPPTPLNARIGPNRKLATLRVELEEIKQIRRSLGGTVNDAVVAIAAGGLRRFFEMHDLDPGDATLRATIPVSTRTDVERGTLGNKIAALAAPLPIGERDPRHRFETTRRALDALKASKQALGTEVATWLAEWTTPALLVQGMRAATRLRSTHLMITNLRGPETPLYCLDAPLLEAYPAPPLAPGQTLSIGLLSYAGFVHWGFVVDADLFPDVEGLAAAVRSEIAELRKLADDAQPRPRRAKRTRRT